MSNDITIDDALVIQVDFRDQKPNIQIKKFARSSCRHREVEVDTETRSVTCQACGAVRDAFDVLTEFAYDERTLWYSRKRLDAQNQRIDELKREEKNIKARIRRARGKLGKQ